MSNLQTGNLSSNPGNDDGHEHKKTTACGPCGVSFCIAGWDPVLGVCDNDDVEFYVFIKVRMCL